jgi:glycosyltransferase involved in cell wall biosynthesis
MLAKAAYRTLGRLVLKGASRLVFVTPSAEKLVTALLGSYPPNGCVIPNGVDTERFHPATVAERDSARARLGLPSGRPVVLFIGRLVEQKGVELLVKVMEHVSSTQFLVVGDGPLAGSLPQGSYVTWQRFVDPQQIHECYHAADCLLLPSYGEGLPLVVQEAASCGLRILISEGESYAGPLIRQQVCAAAPRTAEAMAERLREILAGNPLHRRASGRDYAEAHWSLGTMVTGYVELLEELQTRRRGRS